MKHLFCLILILSLIACSKDASQNSGSSASLQQLELNLEKAEKDLNDYLVSTLSMTEQRTKFKDAVKQNPENEEWVSTCLRKHFPEFEKLDTKFKEAYFALEQAKHQLSTNN